MPMLTRSKPDMEAVYTQYADLLYRVALAQLGNDADAEDAVQDVLIRYMTKAPAFFSRDHEKAWLLRSTVNRCHDIARRNQRASALSLEDAAEVAAEDPSGLSDLLETL
ncbi:MAG: RNA polymerase subunit sigma-24, partial [Clostridia bacterium]|nr:RNA polymerase subunit sigma-24 [Clostridia bacterium]